MKIYIKNFLIPVFLALLLYALPVAAAPSTFTAVAPTPGNASNVTGDFFFVNVTSNESFIAAPSLEVYNHSGSGIMNFTMSVNGSGAGDYVYFNVTGLSSGTFEWRVVNINTTGSNATIQNFGNFTVTLSSTTAVINSPVSGSNTSDSTPEISVTAVSSSLSNLSLTIYTDKAGSVSAVLNTTILNNTATSFDITALANDTYNITVEVGNGADFLVNSTTIVLNVDTVAPSASVSTSTSSVLSTHTVTITCSSSDSFTGVASESLNVAGPSSTGKSVTCGSAYAPDQGTGTYTVTLTTTDRAGNTASDSTTFTVQLAGGDTGPVVKVTTVSALVSVSAGSKASASMPKSDVIGIDKIEFTALNDISGAKVIVKEATTFSALSDPVYVYIEVDKEGFQDSDVGDVEIFFRVPKSWIESNAAGKSIVLKRFDSNTWTSLETSLSSEDSTYAYFTARSPGLSLFAIASEEPVLPAVAPTLRITGPEQGSTVTSSDITVSLQVSGIRLAAPTGIVIEGEGHFHVFLDGANEQRGAQTAFTFENVPVGQHTIRAELHRGDRSGFNPPVSASVNFNVVHTAKVPSSEPGEGSDTLLAVAVILLIIFGYYFVAKRKKEERIYKSVFSTRRSTRKRVKKRRKRR